MSSSKQPSSKKIDPPTQPVESQDNGLLKSPSNTESSPHHQTRADICGLVFGVACIPLMILWSLVIGLGPVLLLVVLVNASGMAGLVSALVFPWKKLPPMAVQPVTARLALRGGLVATLVGGSLAVSYLAFRRIFVEKSAGFISSGEAIFVAFLSILPALLVAGIAARLVASRFVQNNPSVAASDAVVDEKSNRPWYRRGLSPVVLGVCVLGYLSPFVFPSFKFKKSKPIAEKSESIEPEKIIPERSKTPVRKPFSFTSPVGFSKTHPSQWVIRDRNEILDVDLDYPAVLSPDGRFLAYHKKKALLKRSLVVRDLDLNRSVATWSNLNSVSQLAWNQESNSLFYVVDGEIPRVGVLRVKGNKHIPLPVPVDFWVPNGVPLWWEPNEVIFLSDDDGRRLDLDTLRVKPIERSMRWSAMTETEKNLIMQRPPFQLASTRNWHYAPKTQLRSYLLPLEEGTPWKRLRRSMNLTVRHPNTAYERSFREISVSTGDRLLCSPDGSKVIHFKDSKSTVYYFGIEPDSPFVFEARMFYRPESETLDKLIGEQRLHVIVAEPLVNPLTEKYVGPNRNAVHGLARVVEWSGEYVRFWMTEQYGALKPGHVATDLHEWNSNGDPQSIVEDMPEDWWATIDKVIPGTPPGIPNENEAPDRNRSVSAVMEYENGLIAVEHAGGDIRNTYSNAPSSDTSRRTSNKTQKPAPNSGDVTQATVQRFVVAHHNKASSKDVGNFAADYARRVDFFDNGLVSSEFVLKDQTGYSKKWDRISENVNGKVNVRKLSSGLYRAVYRMNFFLESSDGRAINGESEITLDLISTKAGLRITRQRARQISRHVEES